MKTFNPLDWYWQIGADATKAYSSALGDYVLAANPAFVVWKADGTMPTAVDTEANLGGVLAQYYPDVTRPVPATVLDGYQQNQGDDIFKHKLSKLLFQMVNDIRQLKGQAVFTPAQARAYVKGLM